MRLTHRSHYPHLGKVRKSKSLKLFPTSNLSLPTSHLVGLSGFEPLTSRLSGVRSNQLSYRPFRCQWPEISRPEIWSEPAKQVRSSFPAHRHSGFHLQSDKEHLKELCALSKLNRVRGEGSFWMAGSINLPASKGGLPRKEVIQPHLPIRLPCYDFTPITGPTLDGCFPCGLAHRLRVLPTFVV